MFKLPFLPNDLDLSFFANFEERSEEVVSNFELSENWSVKDEGFELFSEFEQARPGIEKESRFVHSSGIDSTA